jgi:hypothetical protein
MLQQAPAGGADRADAGPRGMAGGAANANAKAVGAPLPLRALPQRRYPARCARTIAALLSCIRQPESPAHALFQARRVPSFTLAHPAGVQSCRCSRDAKLGARERRCFFAALARAPDARARHPCARVAGRKHHGRSA